ncbi:MAG: SAM-dependent methyltransferase [Rhodanobacteraceae bacterium]
MARSHSSTRWLQEHFTDPYVKRAQAEGWRSRAAFKLGELIDRERLLRPGMVAVDLGAAPGGWSQMIRDRLGAHGRVIAMDMLPMQGISGVEFVLGDFRQSEALERLNEVLAGVPVDLVLSDMAPNLTGMTAIDQPRMMELVELTDDFAMRHLCPDGVFLTKLFQGAGFDQTIRRLRSRYRQVSIRKPKASRARSPEVYALATGKRAGRK